MRVLLLPWRFVRSFWDGLVTLGLLHTGESNDPHDLALRHPDSTLPLTAAPAFGPPPGHPEQLRPDLPLTALERRLRRELQQPTRAGDFA
ncbi:DUF6059 family protein [Kitasatospora cineracea]|jgi:hypothetical protein|uniref:DUF6059 family protein n=1 Tax=Kitasatospora TaxID=2063 RepID=UPI0004C436EB|nr:DUF6059 family protein [Kitasatospora sp. NRRL B-11411]MDR3033859.1 hypothetical protein [Kitasatospora sp.]